MAESDIFIVYSPKNQGKVDQLKNELISHGYTIREDYKQCVPGTPEWESALEKELVQCKFVIYVASPLTKISRYATKEIQTARKLDRPVLLYWVQGNNWALSAPNGFDSTLYIDAREESKTNLVIEAFNEYTLLKLNEEPAADTPKQQNNLKKQEKRAKPKTQKIQVIKITLNNLSFIPSNLPTKRNSWTQQQRSVYPQLRNKFSGKYDPRFWTLTIVSITIAMLIILTVIMTYILQSS